MTSRDKPNRRAYHAPQRDAAAARTRETIVCSSRELFEDRGWPATTIRAIAEHAAVSQKTVEAFEAAIRDRSEVIACYAVTGDMDFLLHVLAPDLASFSDFALKALLLMPGVRGTRSSFIMQAVKSELAWAPQPQDSARRRR